MNLRRTSYGLAIVALIAIFATSCHSRRFGNDDFPKRMLEHIDEHVEDLQLNAEQNDQYLEIRGNLEADLLKQKESHQTFKTELITIIDQQDADLKDITAVLRNKADDIPAMVNLHLDYMEQFYDILDEQQKALVMAEIRDKADNKHFRR